MNNVDINPDRPLLVGPETPKEPFPFALTGTVIKGYGRGSRELGIPTGIIDIYIYTLYMLCVNTRLIYIL